MPKDDAGRIKVMEHPLLSKLARQAAVDGTALRGYVGPSSDDAHLTLYSSLEDPVTSIEIELADVLHIEDIPEVFQPFGAKTVWVRNDAKTVVRQFAEVKSGRLNMRIPSGRRDSDCVSPCSTCKSECGVCQSICQYTPPTFAARRGQKKRRRKRAKA